MGARLAWNNLLTASGVAITSSSELTGHPDDNLSYGARWKDWTSASSTGDQWVKFDLGSNQTIRVLAAIDATLHSGGTLRLQANATDSWGSPTVNQLITVPTTNYTGVLAAWLSGPVSLRWVRFLFTNTGAVNAAVSLGSVFAGSYLEPDRSVSASLTFRRIDPSVQRYAIGGARSAVLRAKYHEVSGTFPLQTALARNDIRAIYETIGATTSILLTLDPSDASLTFYGTLQSNLSASHRGSDLWDMPIEFVEDVA